MVSTNDLTLADIKFLQAVKDINKHPENYQDSDKGELPANSKSIRKATDLNSNQVSYRMGGNSASKGFAEGDNPLIIPHEPVRNENGFGPRSVELTSVGVEMLDTAQNQINEISGIKREEFNELRSKVENVSSSHIKREEFDKLENRMDNIAKVQVEHGEKMTKIYQAISGYSAMQMSEKGAQELRKIIESTLFQQ